MPKRQSETPRFAKAQLLKLARLLDMLYKPAEIAEEIGVSLDTVKRSYMPAGCPTVKDTGGHVWIHGSSFRSWAEKLHRAKRKREGFHAKMPENQVYCLSCRKAVPLSENPERRMLKGRHVLQLVGICPECNHKTYKLRKVDYDKP